MPLNLPSAPIHRETAVIRSRKEIGIVIAGLTAWGFFIFSAKISAETTISAADVKKRDPFVALVDSAGKIKPYEQLFPIFSEGPLSTDLALKAILWDEKSPAALINNKIYKEGAAITRGLTVEKISPDSVKLNDRGDPIILKLRKPLK